MDIKELRIEKGLTQPMVSEMTGIPLRTYKNYENDPSKKNSIKYNYILNVLEQYGHIDESHGILHLDKIKAIVQDVVKEYNVEYAILFGSYAKGSATETSDIDLLISTEITGMKFFGIAEKLRQKLCKKVDLLDVKQLNNNQELLEEILKDGIRIYVQDKWVLC